MGALSDVPILGAAGGEIKCWITGGCFTAGTPVVLADGTTKAIEDVAQGDEVLSKDEKTGRMEARSVVQRSRRTVGRVVRVTLTDPATHQSQTLTATEDHPFYVQGKGFVPAGQLGVGTSIVTRAGPALTVSGSVFLPQQVGGYTVYNLTVEGDHTYFVGSVDGGAWVHNSCTYSFASEEEAKAAAFERAGFPEHEAYPAKSPLKEGSQSPMGPRGDRTEWEHPDSPFVVSHDPYGHYYPDTGEVMPPHYGVNGGDIDVTEHYVYPSTHEPRTNRFLPPL